MNNSAIFTQTEKDIKANNIITNQLVAENDRIQRRIATMCREIDPMLDHAKSELVEAKKNFNN